MCLVRDTPRTLPMCKTSGTKEEAALLKKNLAAPDLSCGLGDLFNSGMWDLVPRPGIEPCPPPPQHWEQSPSHCTTREKS